MTLTIVQVCPRKPAFPRIQRLGRRLVVVRRLVSTELTPACPFQESQAAKVLVQYHANGGDEHDPLIIFEMAQIRHALKVERDISEKSTFFQLWSTPGNLKRLRIIIAIAIFSQWRSVFLPQNHLVFNLKRSQWEWLSIILY